MKTLIGVPCYNEEKNISGIIELVQSPAIKRLVDEICIVSASSDGTNEIVRRCLKQNPDLVLIEEGKRRGKASALNEILDMAHEQGFDAIVYFGGDNLPKEESIIRILRELEDADMVGGRPVPLDDKKGFLGWYSHLQWNIHHEISIKEAKISGELMAFRTGFVKEVPIAVINDDAYLEQMYRIKGARIKYCEDAMVYLKGCSSYKDLLNQRRRIYLGHLQILFLLGQKIHTFKIREMKTIKRALPSFGVKEFFYLIWAITIQFLAFSLAHADFHTYKIPYRWTIATTTKKLDG